MRPLPLGPARSLLRTGIGVVKDNFVVEIRTIGAQNDYTPFYFLGSNFPIAQDIRYTGRSGRNSFV